MAPWQLCVSSVLLLLYQIESHFAVETVPLNHLQGKHHYTPLNGNSTACNIFAGSWVVNPSYPLYQSAKCPYIEPEFNCQLFGRPDLQYLKYRWQPTNCDIPKFNGSLFLSKMRGKSIMFVGDSLGLNQWQSLICMLYSSNPQPKVVMERAETLSTFGFLDYALNLSFYRAPFLVDVDTVGGKRVLKLDSISENANSWKGQDVLAFNSGHWWSHVGDMRGWDVMEERGTTYPDMDRLIAFQKGMTTWAQWVDANVNHSATRVFLQSVSPTHYKPKEWNDTVSINCFGQTDPLPGSRYPGPYPDQMKVIQSVISGMKNPAYLLDITTQSQLRKDAHPSTYSGELSPQQRANPASSDCRHWCLPGLPDTWNCNPFLDPSTPFEIQFSFSLDYCDLFYYKSYSVCLNVCIYLGIKSFNCQNLF